jgi:hypothetical protein
MNRRAARRDGHVNTPGPRPCGLHDCFAGESGENILASRRGPPSSPEAARSGGHYCPVKTACQRHFRHERPDIGESNRRTERLSLRSKKADHERHFAPKSARMGFYQAKPRKCVSGGSSLLGRCTALAAASDWTDRSDPSDSSDRSRRPDCQASEAVRLSWVPVIE